MNIRLGLERISAVWWGLLAGLCLLAPFITDASDRWLIAGMGAGGLVAAYLAYRLTCWVIGGFSVAKH